MRVIKAVLFEPVGSLAEIPAGPFNEIAARVFNFTADPGDTGSEAYWQLLELMTESGLKDADRPVVERLELQAVDGAHVYEDVVPALEALRAMDIGLVIASSLSARAVHHFLDKSGVADFFSGVWTRDKAGGVKDAPLQKALDSLGYQRDEVMALVDTKDGVELVKEAGANAILMINDYDEGRRLVTHAPTGAIVSLHELPDAIRFVAAGAKVPRATGTT
jgi:beta-phosphoglucomutase-like phosphatase (HAD superfamily)